MIVIRATCNNCDENTEVMNWELHLTVFTHGVGHFYEFLCKECRTASRNYCTEEVVELLVRRGRVPTSFVEVPAEFLEEKAGDPLSLDDLITLHNDLESL